jgi:hypothetical protein
MSESFTPHRCPHCLAARDLSSRVTGDTVLCPDCGGYFTVVWKQSGAVELWPTFVSTPGAMVGRRLPTKRGKR